MKLYSSHILYSIFALSFLPGCNKSSDTSSTASTDGTTAQCDDYWDEVSTLDGPELVADFRKISADSKWEPKWVMENYISKTSTLEGQSGTRNDSWILANAYTLVTTNPQGITPENSCAFYARPGANGSFGLPLSIAGTDGQDGFPDLSKGWVEVAIPLSPDGLAMGPAGGAYTNPRNPIGSSRAINTPENTSGIGVIHFGKG